MSQGQPFRWTSVLTVLVAIGLPTFAKAQITPGDRMRTNMANQQAAAAAAAAAASTTPTLPTAGVTGGSTSGGGGAGDGADSACSAKAVIARDVCNTMSMVGVTDPNQGAMMESMMSQAMDMSTQIQAGGANQSEQCGLQAKLSLLLAGINGIKAAACATTQHLCTDACDGAAKTQTNTTIKAADQRASATCSSYTVNTMMATMQALNFGKSMLQDQACAAATAATPYVAPTLSAAGTDCSDPTMASTSISCICAANPSDSICGNSSAAGTIGGSATTLGSTGPGSVARPTDLTTGSDGITPTGLGSPSPQTGVTAAQAAAGGASGLTGLPNTGGAPGGGDDGGGGVPVDKQSVIMGQGSGGGGGGSGAPGNPNGTGKTDLVSSFLDKFNLNKLLPNKKDYQNRGIAGMAGTARDGITGPMGPTIWEKVTNQYQVQKIRLIQDR